jgi:formiminoglutamate deiminase
MTGATSGSYLAAHALLPGGVVARDVRIDVEAGVIVGVRRDAAPGEMTRLDGVVLPGFANVHSHAFHRALRGRTHAGGGTFWTWREGMYAVAERLDPDRYYRLARATYAEMVLAGYTAVGEFHYVHHEAGGVPYADPNAMAGALIQAAADAGIRLTLLDTCYLSAGVDGAPLTGPQLRFGDRDADRWAERLRALIAATPPGRARIGAAIHSVRAVPRAALPTVVRAAENLPLHVHLSEQRAENHACLAAYGCTPTELLAGAGALTPRTTAVHATHLTAGDVATLGAAGVHAGICPTTERDLADGIGPARALLDAGAVLGLGSDQHAVIDGFEEARGLEMDERLVTGKRGRFRPGELLDALTDHAALGRSAAGLRAGAPADLVVVRTDTPRTAGADPAQIVLAATAADIGTVLVGGEVVVRDGVHRIGDVGRLLADAIEDAWPR